MADPNANTKPDDPALSLSTLFRGTTITIDHARYIVRSPDALSLGAYKRIERDFPRLGALLQRAEITDAEERELEALLVSAVADVLDAPAEIKAILSPVQRVSVVEAFVELRLQQRAAVTGAGQRPNGASSSRGSNGSMADRRRRGSKRSR